jgi:hypothetical protein
MKVFIALACACLFIAPVTAKAESQQDQMACMSDAFNVCGHAIPDRDRVAACLAETLKRLSTGCREVMARYNKPAPRSRARVTSVRD